jgi:hypothetical protein
VKVVVPRDPV